MINEFRNSDFEYHYMSLPKVSNGMLIPGAGVAPATHIINATHFGVE
jgi:hypothetical protein